MTANEWLAFVLFLVGTILNFKQVYLKENRQLRPLVYQMSLCLPLGMYLVYTYGFVGV